MMRAIVVYESMYGNTRHVAEAVASGLGASDDVKVVPVSAAGAVNPEDFDLVVVGGPTHAHGMSHESTRLGAEAAAQSSAGHLVMEPDAVSVGVREWLRALSGTPGRAAAFDTRYAGAPLLTGRASKGIDRHLRRAGFTMVAPPESFLVAGKDTILLPEEETRAKAWGGGTCSNGVESPSRDPGAMKFYRPALVTLLLFGAISAFAGAVMALAFDSAGMPLSSLARSPFRSFMVPGLILGLVVGGTQLLAAIALLTNRRWSLLAAAVA